MKANMSYKCIKDTKYWFKGFISTFKETLNHKRGKADENKFSGIDECLQKLF